MSVFHNKLIQRMTEEIVKLKGETPNMELWVLESDLAQERIYHGNSLSELKEAMIEWSPDTGASSPAPALRVGRSLVGINGGLIYFTDTPVESVAYGASVYAVGSEIPNVGFTGVSYRESPDGYIWEASVKNYTKDVVSINWQVVYSNSSVGDPVMISLEADELKIIRGVLPPETARAQVRLSADQFLFDNTLPIFPPQPKVLRLGTSEGAPKVLVERIIEHFDHLEAVAKDTDLLITTQSPESAILTQQDSLVLLTPQKKTSYEAMKIVGVDHPLISGLNWQSLLVQKESRIIPEEDDQVLLWGGSEALIFLRTFSGLETTSQLVLNFTVDSSNALQQEAFVLLLYRYIESQREGKKAPVRLQTELNQKVSLANRDQSLPMELEVFDLQGQLVSTSTVSPYVDAVAPNQVGFFRLIQEGELLLTASNLFADTREADLRDCASQSMESLTLTQAEEQVSDNTMLWRILLLIALGALLVSWSNFRLRNLNPSST